MAGPPAAAVEEEAGNEASEWQNRESEEHLAQMAEEEARQGVGGHFVSLCLENAFLSYVIS